MSTAGNQRVTRSVSKARSTGAASTGAASVGAPSRGHSRRPGPAVPLTEDDKPAVGNQVNRAYGTEGKSAQAHLLSAQIGMTQAINPIANAVFKAQAPVTPIANNVNRLEALSEEPEGSERSDQLIHGQIAYIDERRPYSVDSSQSAPLPQQPQESFLSSLSRHVWAPLRGRFNAEGANRTSNNIIEASMQGGIDRPDQSRINGFLPRPREYYFAYPWSWAALVKDALFFLTLLFGIFCYYKIYRAQLFRPGNESEISQNSNISLRQAQQLHHRMSHIEQKTQDRSLSSGPNDAAAAEYQINWFAPGFGASVDLYLSSPTVSECDPTWTPDGWPWSMFKSQPCPQISLSAPQYAALYPWTDPVDDAWCAPPSNGKLQLAVVLPRTIAPTDLVVEHAVKGEMPAGYMGSSPKEVELWIQIPDDTTRATVREAIASLNPSLLEDTSPQGKTIGDQALPFDYVPVGRWIYDIYANRREQNFLVPLSLSNYGVSTTKVAVRVNSNWGNINYTCLSRLRLYGEDTSGTTEKLDSPLVEKASWR